MTTITLTGDNNYSGTYQIGADATNSDDGIFTNFWVLGGASDGGHNDIDTTTGDEVFLFGNLQFRSTTVTDTSYDGSGTGVTSGTYQTTATADSGDTLHFTFDVSLGQHFHFDAWNGLENSQAAITGVESAYQDWLGTLPQGAVLSDPISGTFSDPPHGTADFNGFLDADVAGTGVTAEHGGIKVLLGFSVGSDHIALDGITSESMFDSNFTVTSTTHTSANGNTVHDTTIALNGGGWSVDLYGVDTSATTNEADLQHFAYTQLTTNGASV